uniref:Uncharacterized protein n=1 Tax=Setaria viridis TaxID=4556 RepID=A0A4V6D7A7_SETVI|nr:hypothetical protein SEVIR_5G373950v2 [Setaria viridis]
MALTRNNTKEVQGCKVKSLLEDQGRRSLTSHLLFQGLVAPPDTVIFRLKLLNTIPELGSLSVVLHQQPGGVLPLPGKLLSKNLSTEYCVPIALQHLRFPSRVPDDILHHKKYVLVTGYEYLFQATEEAG